ncbi:MAG: endonuclease/exonuclease/phosphatase family protein [Geminicoccaceae bacterium]
MKIVTYNIQFTRGRDHRFDLPRVAATVEGADIIGLQEVDRFWRRTGMQDQAEALAEHFPGYFWCFAGGYDVAAALPDPMRADAASRGRRRQHGNMVLSRWPILSARTLRLPRGKPAVWSQDRVLLETVIDAPSGPLRVYVTHLCHISPQTRLPQVDYLVDLLKTLPIEGATWSGEHPDPSWTDGDAPPPFPDTMILMGDLNFSPDAEEYGRMFGADLELIDSWKALNRDPRDPSEYSFRSVRPPDKTIRIDHIFVSQDLASRLSSGWIDQDAQGSDHYPVWVALRD